MENNPRLSALKTIYAVVVTKKSLSSSVFFQQNDDNQALVKSLVYGVIRFYHKLNDIVTPMLSKSIKKQDLDVYCLIILGAYQLLHTNIPVHAVIFETVETANDLDKTWAKKLINAILRKISRNKENLQKIEHYSHPTWLVKKIKNYYPNQYQQIFTQNNTQAPMTIRVSPKYNLDTYKSHLNDIGVNSYKSDVAAQALILEKPLPVTNLPYFNDGSCYVQDASAQLAAQLLEPKDEDIILDACSAPGGKSTHLAQLAPNSTIIALDNDAARLKNIQQNIERLKIKNITITQGEAQYKNWWSGEKFDKILLDLPCSATGVIRRHPDIKLLRKAKDITQLVLLQQQILQNIWSMLKPGGTLLYATCSILKVENEEQIKKFLDKFKDAKEDKINLNWGTQVSFGLQQLPSHEFDGFYYAKLKKIYKRALTKDIKLEQV